MTRRTQATHWLVYRGTHVIACGRPQSQFSPKLLSTEDKGLVNCLSCKAIMTRTVGPVEQRLESHPDLIERDMPVPVPRVDEPIRDYQRSPRERRIMDKAKDLLAEQFAAQRKRWGFA